MTGLPTKASDLLACAIAFLPGHWIQGDYARRGPSGSAVQVWEAEATCFCMVGCLRRCELGTTVPDPRLDGAMFKYPLTYEAIGYLHGSIGRIGSLEGFNDHRQTTEADVLAALVAAHGRALNREAQQVIVDGVNGEDYKAAFGEKQE